MFDSGIVVFFRAFAVGDNNLARSVHPDGRDVTIGSSDDAHPDDYIVSDANGKLLGAYPRDWVAAIMPLQTTGPADASNQQTGRDSAPSPTAGDPQGKPGRAKRFNPN